MRRRAVLVPLVLVCALGGMTPAHAGDPTPTVTMTQDRPTSLAGETQRFTVVVTGANGGSAKALRITALFPNGSTKVFPISSANDDTFHRTDGISVNHTLRAELIDESANVLAWDQLAIVRLAKLTTDPKGGYLGYSGSYVVFPKRSRPVFRSRDLTGKVAPRCLRHQVQRRYASGWKPVVTSACRAEQSAVVDWKWVGKHPSGVRFRVRATFAGDKWNRGNTAAWKYFRLR